MNSTDLNYAAGKLIAQTFSQEPYRILNMIYNAYVEPHKEMPSCCQGVLDEIAAWKHVSSGSKAWLEKITASQKGRARDSKRTS